MKVVIFCGGFGVRMGEETQRIPKPMIEIGDRPILWHIMRYYAIGVTTSSSFRPGYKGDLIKEYFLTYNGAPNDFVLDEKRRRSSSCSRAELDDWRITFVDTGLSVTIGERLKAVERFIGDDDALLATYGDGLTDAPLPQVIDAFRERDKLAMFLSVHRSSTRILCPRARTVPSRASTISVRPTSGSTAASSSSSVRSWIGSGPATSWSRRPSAV